MWQKYFSVTNFDRNLNDYLSYIQINDTNVQFLITWTFKNHYSRTVLYRHLYNVLTHAKSFGQRITGKTITGIGPCCVFTYRIGWADWWVDCAFIDVFWTVHPFPSRFTRTVSIHFITRHNVLRITATD